MMQKLSHRFRHCMALTAVLLTLVADIVRFLRLCLRPRPTLAAENLFLRKQLALYQERQFNPGAPPMPPALPSSGSPAGSTGARPWPLCNPRPLLRWHRQGFRLFWRWKSRPDGRRSLRTCKRSSAGWPVRTRRGARSALPMNCC